MIRRALTLLAFAALIAPSAAPGFTLETIASVPQARELAMAPDGTLFAGTSGGDVYVVRAAEGAHPSASIFTSPGDAPAAGVAFANNTLYVGTQHAVWSVPYHPGQNRAASAPKAIAHVRGGDPPPGSDGDVHTTTSVAASGNRVYASVGSSCNACVEIDASRATVGEIRNGRYDVIAKRIRNAIALAVDERGSLWASDAGQDELPPPHPYEFFDNLGARKTPADYGWPVCFENGKHKPGTSASCANVAVPDVVFPAYETPIGAVFYPADQRGRYAFPNRFRGGAFVTLHGSWHGPRQGLSGYLPPRVVFIPMKNARAASAPDWNDPSRQWTDFVAGYQSGGSVQRTGRPSGIAVGPQGSLFIADDQAGVIYRVRPR